MACVEQGPFSRGPGLPSTQEFSDCRLSEEMGSVVVQDSHCFTLDYITVCLGRQKLFAETFNV